MNRRKIMHLVRSVLQMVPVLMVVGCAATAPQPSPVEATSAVSQGPAIRLEEGRFGFVINEDYPYDFNQKELFTLGLDALQSGEYDVAVDCFTSITKASPRHSSPYINLAIAYIRSGREGQAEKPLKEALKIIAGHPLASHEYGLLLRRAGRFAEARAVYEESLQSFPEYFPLRKNLGILCDLYLNDQKCAISQYELFLEAQPGDEQVTLWLTEVKSR